MNAPLCLYCGGKMSLVCCKKEPPSGSSLWKVWYACRACGSRSPIAAGDTLETAGQAANCYAHLHPEPNDERPANRRNPREGDVLVIAAYMIRAAVRLNVPITAGKLQKLLYEVQGMHMAMMGRPAFFSPILVGTYGPNIRAVEAKYAANGAMALTDAGEKLPALHEATQNIIDDVVERRAGLRYGELVMDALATPPCAAHKNTGTPIELDEMAAYFKTLL